MRKAESLDLFILSVIYSLKEPATSKTGAYAFIFQS